MQVHITGLKDPERPILAIKGVRVISGLGLKEAKAVVDAVLAGQPQVIPVITSESRAWVQDYLGDHNVQFAILGDGHLVANALRAMPSHLTVAEVLSVAQALGL